jgi:hypothetical protein
MSSRYDIEAIQGNTLLLSVIARDSNSNIIDLNGYGVRGYVKYQYSDTGKLLDLNPQITMPSSGIINISGDANAISSLPVGKLVYDLEVYNGNYVTKFLNGYFSVAPEVTS